MARQCGSRRPARDGVTAWGDVCCHSDNSPVRCSKGTNSLRFPCELMVILQAPSSLLAKRWTAPSRRKQFSLSHKLFRHSARMLISVWSSQPPNKGESYQFISSLRYAGSLPHECPQGDKTLPHISSCSTFKHDNVFCKYAYMDISVATSVRIYICGPCSKQSSNLFVLVLGRDKFKDKEEKKTRSFPATLTFFTWSSAEQNRRNV